MLIQENLIGIVCLFIGAITGIFWSVDLGCYRVAGVYNMDRAWILNDDRLSSEYRVGIESFVKVASNHLNKNNECRCPCRRCANRSLATLTIIRAHLMRFGFTVSYDVWVCHGEKESSPSTFLAGSCRNEQRVTTVPEDVETDDDDVMRPLYEDLAREAEREGSQPHLASNQSSFFGYNAEKLYPGCKFSTLEAVVRLMEIKVVNRWSNNSFQMVLNYIKLMWPDLTNFPSTMYDARKRLRDVGLGYQKIDACRNDCTLFWKEYANNDRCHVCEESRYKVNEGKGQKVPHKSLRYFPITQRLQRLFVSRHTAEDMRWHKDKRDASSDSLIHPADGEAWQHFDNIYPEFADDPRNVRLGLAADGFNPFSANYSMWPVIVVPYNLPPWRCMQQPFRMLSLLIPGPTSPGKEIDVYLRPLIDELKDLWNIGVETYDAASKNRFQMRATLLWTINDFPAYGNLSGWSTHGKKACPVCMDETTFLSITSKICFMGHRRYLALTHTWRRSKMHDGKLEHRPPPKIKTGDEILFHLNRLPIITFGKHLKNRDFKRKRIEIEQNWTKRSVFFELPYWSKLLIRHILDVMHIEKNICDNVLHTLLNTDGRTKDTIKARIDLENLKIRKDLHLKKLANGKIVKPAACYVLKASDRSKFLEFFTSVRFPDGYAANLSRSVNVREGKIYGLKTHDCHVIFQRLLPIAIRPFLPKDLCSALVGFSLFFQQLTSKSLLKSDLDNLQESIVMVLCKLERIYPPAFFDVMIHLAVHLVREARLAGPVGPRWMYPFERDMGIYKSYTRNRAHPEGSIAEAYSIYEALTFCSMYFTDSEHQFTHPDRNDDQVEQKGTISVFVQKAKPFGGASIEEWSKSDIEEIHFAVLNHCDELADFVNEHMRQLEMNCPEDLYERHRDNFSSWFQQHVKNLRREGSSLVTDEIYALSNVPSRSIICYPCCIVNGVRFRIKEQDDRKKTQNSGVSVLGEHIDDEIDYYGFLTKIIVLKYIMDYTVVVFKCEWYDTNPRKKRIKRDYQFTSIHTKDRWFENDPYILAIQAKQIFYVDDPKFGKDWKVVQKVEQRQVWNISEKQYFDGAESPLDAYQQDEYVRIECELEPGPDPSPLNDNQHIGDIEVTNLTEENLEELRQLPQGTNDYEPAIINDEVDDQELDENDGLNSDSDN